MTRDSNGPSLAERGGEADARTAIAADETPSEVIVRTVASLRNENPADLEPLFGTVDPDAVDALYERGAAADLEVGLTYGDCEIVVTRGTVRARLLGDAER